MKYYCNDQEVTEEVYLKVVEDHKQWVTEQEKKTAAALAEQLKAEKKGKKK